MAKSRVEQQLLDKVNDAFNKISLPEDQLIASEFKGVLNFQGKKSLELAAKLIASLSDSNALIYEPFFGSGAFLLACSKANRKVIGTELDNYTFNSFKILITKSNFTKLNELFLELSTNVKEKIMNLYETKCCGKINYITKLHFDPLTQEYMNPKGHRDIHNGKNIKLLYKCPICKNKDKKFDEYDRQQIEKLNSIDTSRFPKHRFIENSRINITSSTGADKYDTNFSKRSQIALLLLQDEILKFPASHERDVVEYALVYSLALAKIAMYGSGTDNLYHVIQYQAQEMNVWTLFEEKFNNIIKYKQKFSYALQSTFTEVDKICLINEDYKTYLNSTNIKFDMIYTDPPYTDQCPYLEKSQYFRDWLKEFYSKEYTLTSEMLDKEIVVTNAPSRLTKTLDNYYKDLDSMFQIFSSHIKENGLLIFTLKLGTAKYFTTFVRFINYARKHGFEFVSNLSIDNTDPTIRKQAAFVSTMSTQIIVVFQKLPVNLQYWYIDDVNVDKYIVKTTYNLIKTVQSNITLSKLIDQFENKFSLELNHLINNDEKNKIAAIIKNNFYVDEFTNVSFDPNELYIGMEDQNSLFIKLYNIVPVIIKKLLSKQGFFYLDDIYYEIALKLCDDSKLLEAFIENEEYKNNIEQLIDNYCEVSNKSYIARKVENQKNDNSVDISSLDGYEFEKLIIKLLQKEKYIDAIRIGGAGDRGVDIIAKDPLNPGKKVLFQCKRWVANVDSTPIQRLHSMKTMYGDEISRAVCITTSNYTKEAKIIANSTNVELIDGSTVLTMLEKHFPGEYYHALLK